MLSYLNIFFSSQNKFMYFDTERAEVKVKIPIQSIC